MKLISPKDIKVVLFAVFIMVAQYAIFKPSVNNVYVKPDNEYKKALIKENRQLKTDIKTLKNDIKKDSSFINSIGKDSLRDIANGF